MKNKATSKPILQYFCNLVSQFLMKFTFNIIWPYFVIEETAKICSKYLIQNAINTNQTLHFRIELRNWMKNWN